jgi:hypothetical protein
MVEGRERAAWQHTASLMALVCSVAGSKSAAPADFIPEQFRPPQDQAAIEVPVSAVAHLFPKRRKQE